VDPSLARPNRLDGCAALLKVKICRNTEAADPPQGAQHGMLMYTRTCPAGPPSQQGQAERRNVLPRIGIKWNGTCSSVNIELSYLSCNKFNGLYTNTCKPLTTLTIVPNSQLEVYYATTPLVSGNCTHATCTQLCMQTTLCKHADHAQVRNQQTNKIIDASFASFQQ
jgi:hypothetical protein